MKLIETLNGGEGGRGALRRGDVHSSSFVRNIKLLTLHMRSYTFGGKTRMSRGRGILDR